MTIAGAANGFGMALWRQMPPGNMVMSPPSVAVTLAMTWTGARGETAAQMARVLGLDGDADRVAAQWGALTQQLRADDAVALRIANRLYGQRGYQFVDGFCRRLERGFDAPMETVDFGQADAVRAAINAWIDARTEHAIAQLLPDGAIDPLVRLVLVNAIYFRGTWAVPFEKHRTVARAFWVGGTRSAQVPTMHRKGEQWIAPIDGGRIAFLPYRGGTTAMVIVLPDERTGLDAVERALTAHALADAIASVETATVELALPRFVADPPVAKLNTALSELGMPLAFDSGGADFTAMAEPADPADRLHLDAVFHKAYVKTDEKGTIAAAATAGMMAARGMPARPEPFIVDRPFGFYIIDTRSGLVLFMGRIVDPRVAA